MLCSCSVSVQVSPYLRERRCERIEVFSSVSSSLPPSDLHIQRFRTEKSFSRSLDFYRKLDSFCSWGGGEGDRGIGERDNGARGEKRGFLFRVVVARSGNEQRRQFAGKRFGGDEAEEERDRLSRAETRGRKPRDTEGEGSVGRFPLSAVNTAHGRRYNWRRPRMPDNSNDNEDKRNRAGEENNGGRSVQSRTKNERASELLDLTEFNLRLSHFSGLSLTRPRQPLPPEYLDSRALIVLVKGPRSLRNIIPVVHLFFNCFYSSQRTFLSFPNSKYSTNFFDF